MAKIKLAFLVFALVSSPAWSVPRTGQQNQYSGGQQNQYSGKPVDIGYVESQPKQCLRHKQTGRVKCRTVSEWREIAQKIDRAAAHN